MPGENIQDWSTTAANNGTADSSINWAEGMARSAVNNSARSMMAAVAKDRNLKNGSITTGGTANAQTFTSGVTYTSVPTGLRATLKIGASLTNTGAVTLNMDGIGAVTIKDKAGADLAGGNLRAGQYAEFLYNGTNWIFLGVPVGDTFVNVRVFTSNGTYPTVTNGGVKVLVMCKGGGGSGGGNNVAGATAFGGGGGEGQESWKLTAASNLSGQTVTVGAGGTGIGANTNSDGAAGNTTSIGSVVTAGGGGGGLSCPNGGVPGAGGSGGTNDWGMPGCPGGGGTANAALAVTMGIGGGKGGGIPQVSANGVANSGGGGAGARGTGSGSGNGGSGIVICYEFGVI